MSERLPYEEQLNQSWDDLPLPDENMAWKDMKRRLDKDDDDKVVVPPPRRGCGIGALLFGLLLLGGFWLLVRPEKWFMSKKTETAEQTKTENVQKDSIGEKQDVNSNKKDDPIERSTDQNRKENTTIKTNDESNNKTVKDSSSNTSLQNENDQKNETEVEIKTVDAGIKKNKPKPTNRDNISKDKPPVLPGKKKKQGNDEKPKNVISKKEDVLQPNKTERIEKKETDQPVVNSNDDQLVKKEPTETKTVDIPVVAKNDSAIAKPADTIAKKQTEEAKPKKEKERKPIFFAAGIGLHQQIPIGDQEWTTYGSLGRKGILSDYIPSVNFRMEKQDRWFLQTEFRYGAPQHTKQFTYEQVIKFDTASQSTITNSSVLKKTFYHQVPLTFNYYVLPNWSIGTGIQWNKFYSAVAEQDLRRRRPGTNNDSLISQKIVKVNADTVNAFAKSWFQGIFQTQYQWKRFSIGARYSFALQPYIKFTLPNQPLQEEKNSSFQIFLRYELWRSKK